EDEVTITYTEGAAGDPAEGTPGKKRVVEITKKDGSTIRGEVVEEGKNESITIKPRGQGNVTIKLADTTAVTPIEDSGSAEIELGERFVDYEGRFQIERPSADWRLRKSTSPETRALMILLGRDAFLAVAVKPVVTTLPAYIEPTKG